MTRIAVTGVGGRMGTEVIQAVTDRERMEVVTAVNRSATTSVAGISVVDAAQLPSRLAADDPDVLVDFTGPESSVEYITACERAGIPAVTGTTGFDESQLSRLREVAEQIPLVRATNFARGVTALRRALREAVAALPDYDVEVTETHHNGKRDAPSGTATTLLSDIETERNDIETRTHGREGIQPRQESEIGVHARRAGNVTGEHEVLLAGNREVLELTHRAGSRGVFAEGALDAASWVTDRDPGWYEFDDVIDS